MWMRRLFLGAETGRCGWLHGWRGRLFRYRMYEGRVVCLMPYFAMVMHVGCVNMYLGSLQLRCSGRVVDEISSMDPPDSSSHRCMTESVSVYPSGDG